MANLMALPPRPSRISTKLRAAIEARVTMGLSIAEACEQAGLSKQGWHKAVKRAVVRDYIEEAKRQFVLSTEAKRALYRAQALETAFDLMRNAKSESIRARMCEFLASDAKVSPVAVHIDARAPSAYSFVKPVGHGMLPAFSAVLPESEQDA